MEYGSSGAELQRSTKTAADGSFQFSRRLSGSRIEALYAPAVNRVEQVHSAQLGSAATFTQLEVTPLTTWYDQMVINGESASGAAAKVLASIAANCSSLTNPHDVKYLFASSSIPAIDHDWLLAAVSAYLQAARALGVGPKVDFIGWAQALDRHGAVLAQLCSFSSTISAANWAAAQADRLKQERKVPTIDSARLAEGIADARAQGLAVLALQIQQSEFPDQTAVLRLANINAGHELALSSDFVMERYLLPSASVAGTLDFDGPPSTLGLAITHAGNVVQTLQGSISAAGSARVIRFSNQGATEKLVHLVLNGQSMAGLPEVIGQILAMPVAYSGEPPYRKAWRYLMAHKRNTQPLAISFFQFQPDLWLRSVASSYCEAQAAVLYRIWRAMGYEARVHALTGHVTVEVRIDGRWLVFDPYLQVYYTDRAGKIVGVRELEQDRTLITNPQEPLLPISAIAYSEVVADAFATGIDNYVAYDYMSTEPEPLGDTFEIPPGGYIQLSDKVDVSLDSTEVGYQVEMSTMKLWVPPGYVGTLRLPLVLLDVKGSGSVRLLGRTLTAAGSIDGTVGLSGLGDLDTTLTSPSIQDRLQNFYFHDSSSIGVSELKINSSGVEGITLTLLVNPLFFQERDRLTVKAYGAYLSGLRLVGVPP